MPSCQSSSNWSWYCKNGSLSLTILVDGATADTIATRETIVQRISRLMLLLKLMRDPATSCTSSSPTYLISPMWLFYMGLACLCSFQSRCFLISSFGQWRDTCWPMSIKNLPIWAKKWSEMEYGSSASSHFCSWSIVSGCYLIDRSLTTLWIRSSIKTSKWSLRTLWTRSLRWGPPCPFSLSLASFSR